MVESMPQMLLHDEIEMGHEHPDLYMNELEEVLDAPDENDVGFFVDVDSKYLDQTKQKSKIFPFAPENKIINENKYNEYKKKIKPKKYTKVLEIIK